MTKKTAEYGQPVQPTEWRRRRSPHEFYVYHDGCDVLARKAGAVAIVAETFDTPQEAADKVQSIVNPDNKHHHQIGPRGFLEVSFQKQISARCQAYVEAAYAKVEPK